MGDIRSSIILVNKFVSCIFGELLTVLSGRMDLERLTGYNNDSHVSVSLADSNSPEFFLLNAQTEELPRESL